MIIGTEDTKKKAMKADHQMGRSNYKIIWTTVEKESSRKNGGYANRNIGEITNADICTGPSR